MGAAARPEHVVQLSAAGVRADHHGGRVFRVRGAVHDRHRARHGAPAGDRDLHRPGTRDAAVPRTQPPLRGGRGRRRRRPAGAAGRGVDARRDPPAVAALRGEHLVRVDRDPAPGARGARGEHRGPRGSVARGPGGAGGCPGTTAAAGRHVPAPGRLGCGAGAEPLYGHGAPPGPAFGTDAQLPAQRRGHRLVDEAQGLAGHAVRRGHAARGRG